MSETSIAVPLTHGVRHIVGTVGVDAGTVAITTRRGGGHDEPVLSDEVQVSSAWQVQATSGFGDGEYEVVDVTRDDEVWGLEAVFICSEAYDAADAAIVAAGFGDPQPYPGLDASIEERDRWIDNDFARNRCRYDAFAAHIVTADPTADAVPEIAGSFDHDGGEVEVTDPFVGHTGPVLTLPAGHYVAVRWTGNQPNWGPVCMRLGIYRTS